MSRSVTLYPTVLLAFLSFLTPYNAVAQAAPGIHVGWGGEADFAIGGRVNVPFTAVDRPLRFTGSFDWFFPSAGFSFESDAGEVSASADYWEILAGVTHPFPLEGEDFEPYAGAALFISRSKGTLRDPSGTLTTSDSNGGLSLLGGLVFDLDGDRDFQPFIEIRRNLATAEQFVFVAGVTF